MSDETAQPIGDEQPAGAAAPQAEKAKDKKPAKAKETKGKSGKDTGKTKDKGKGKGKGKKASGGLSVASHPRAHAQVRRAKGWGGLGGFAIAAYLSFRAGVPPAQIGLRALAAGAIGYMVAWATAVTVWRHLVLAEMKARYEQHKSGTVQGVPIKGAITGPKDDGPPA
jgi:hypothetical protein